MKPLTSMMLAACVVFGTSCWASDLAAERKALQEAVDAAVEKYPDLADLKKFIAKRIKGKNGWGEFIKLTEQWAKIRAEDKEGEWSYFFEYINDPSPTAYSDNDRAQMRIGLERSQPIAEGAAKLLEFDCLIADPSDPLDMEKSMPILGIISFFECLKSRAVVLSVLGQTSEDITAAALLSFKLAMKADFSIHLSGLPPHGHCPCRGHRQGAFRLRKAAQARRPSGVVGCRQPIAPTRTS